MPNHETVRPDPGTVLEFAATVMQQLPRDISPDVMDGWMKNKKALGKALRAALMPPADEKPAPTRETVAPPAVDPAQTKFTVPVDYNQSVEVMTAAGAYDWKNPDITSQNFPVNRRENGEVIVRLVHFDQDMESDGVIAGLDAMGLRPAELPEMLALGAKHPDLQREYPVIALGSAWLGRDGIRLVPFLVRDGSNRYLYLFWYGRRWLRVCRFAALSK